MKNIITIVRISKPLHPIAYLLAGLIVLGAVAELTVPILSKFIVDEVVEQISAQQGDLSDLYFYIILAFVFAIVNVLITTASQRLGDHFGDALRKFLTQEFYHKILTLSQTYFDSEMSGKILNQFNRGIMSIELFSKSASNFILPIMLQSIFVVAVLLYYNIYIGLFVFALFPIYFVLSQISATIWGKEEVRKNETEDTLRGRVHEVIANIRVVKGFTTELKEIDFVNDKLDNITRLYARQSWTFHQFDFLRNVALQLILFATGLILYRSTFDGTMTIGEMVLILQLINQVRRPLFSMSFILTQLQQAEAGSKEFLKILELPSSEMLPLAPPRPFVTDPSLKFDRVTFAYEDDRPAIRDISFSIYPGETVALVGHSGAGKTTLTNLMNKLYETESGEIYLANRPYGALSHADVRSHIALVFQENELFSSTIKENVAYGLPASDGAVIAALKKANAYDFVQRLPHGIHSEVGERGVKLSGGQKQRIQIARAVLADRPILILDEATSHLDAKSEMLVQEALDRLMANKMVIIIAHRFSTIQNADRILVIDQGRLVDCGTPQELSTRSGIYQELLRHQLDGNKKLLANYELF